MNTFLSNQNVKTLWDVIIDEDMIKCKPADFVQNISQMFINNMEKFYQNEKGSCKNLLEMNQKYIVIVLNYANQLEEKMKKIASFPAPQKITHEASQNDRKNKLEHEFKIRQKEFESKTITKPNFSNNFEDTPINNMDQILKQLIEQRNYDIYNSPQTGVQNTNWLTPQETSVKNEKMPQQQKNIVKSQQSQQYPRIQNGIKYIKIDEELDNNIIQSNVINLDYDSPRKSVSWGENKIHDITYENIDNDLFKKLKKIMPDKEEVIKNESTNIELLIEDQDKYQQLQSQINGLNNKVETINTNINMILELLKNNNISTSSH